MPTSNALELFEQAGPPKAGGELRASAGALAQKLQQNPSNLLALQTEQLTLQGELLKALPTTAYEDIVGSLHEDLKAALAHESAPLESASVAIGEALVPLAQHESGVVDTKQLSAALNNHSNALAEHLQVAHARYEEVLKTPDLPAAQKANIERSRDAFVDYAIRVGTQTDRMLTDSINSCSERADQLQEQADKAKKEIENAGPGKANSQTVEEHRQLQKSSESWKAASQLMKQVKKDYKPPEELAAAVHNAKLPTVLAKFEEQSSFFNKIRALLPKLFQQLVASAGHFGAVRAAIEWALRNANFGARVTGAGAGLGASHELINNTVRPWVNELLVSLTGREVRPVKFSEVSSQPTEQYTVDGVSHKRSPAEMAAAKKAYNEFKTRFAEAQNNHKFGTMKGELEFFSGFGLAQGILEGLVDAGVVPAKTIPALVLASATGGAVSASLQTWNQLTTTVKDDQGREVRTHVPVGVDKALLDRLGKVTKDGFKAIDLRSPDVQEAFLSKMYGAIQGVTISTAVSDYVKDLDLDKPAHIASKVFASSFGPALTLSSFFAAMQNKIEAKKGGTGRMGNVGNNLLAPDRETLPHTTPKDTKSRKFENLIHRGRGVLQAPSQATTVASAALVQSVLHPSATAKSFATMMRGTPSTSQESQIEMGQMGRPS
ncbi:MULTISPECIES: hypothetical protein [Pseudomonas]|uniref:Uncharacterized protein n=1 Tax=Pseudomonas quercus TaxID=2722792 RepID=A0ABX0YH37_9PSED|nr:MULTISPECIES: hypothetical protein [Pseudomonas]MBF7143777.1 hypothetical protein [Pseudomonas sp. LY10J]NJP02346.1 hypothetical protein [Pseudomonas quercus]